MNSEEQESEGEERERVTLMGRVVKERKRVSEGESSERESELGVEGEGG